MAVNGQVYEPAVPLDALVEHPRNPRRGQLATVAESIDTNGWYGAIIAQRGTGHVLAGHTRRRALLEAGATTGAVLWLDCDDETAQRILVADNQTAALAEWDDRALADLLSDLALTPGQLAGTGFDADALAAMSTDLALPDTPPAPADPDAQNQGRKAMYNSTELRQIVLVYQREEYERVVDGLEALRVAAGAPTYAAVVTDLVHAAQTQVPAAA